MSEVGIIALDDIIAYADFVLNSSESNKYGSWIGNEHALLRWTKDIRAYIAHVGGNDPRHIAILALLDAGMAHPYEAEDMKQRLIALRDDPA